MCTKRVAPVWSVLSLYYNFAVIIRTICMIVVAERAGVQRSSMKIACSPCIGRVVGIHVAMNDRGIYLEYLKQHTAAIWKIVYG